MPRIVQHRQERQDRKAAAQNRALREKNKQLERTVARQQKLIERLQNDQGATESNAGEAGSLAHEPSSARASASVPAATTSRSECACDAPSVHTYKFGAKTYRICRNCHWRKRLDDAVL